MSKKTDHFETGGNKDSEETSLEEASEEMVRKRILTSSPTSHRGNSPQASPRFVAVEELMQTAKDVTNMALAHEILVNREFKLKPTELPEGCLERRVKEMMHKTFWECLEAQLKEDPPTYGHVIKLVAEIKEARQRWGGGGGGGGQGHVDCSSSLTFFHLWSDMLLSFLPANHSRLGSRIEEALDLPLIQQQAENGVLDIGELSQFIIWTMGSLCAPCRDEDIKRLKEITDVVPLLREIFSVLDLMKMDMANFAVSYVRPHLMKQSVEYERSKFQEFLDRHPSLPSILTIPHHTHLYRPLTPCPPLLLSVPLVAIFFLANLYFHLEDALDYTEKWLKDTVTWLREARAEGSGGASAGSPSHLPINVHNQAYLRLLLWDHVSDPFPETVLMDQVRFQQMQQELEPLVLLSSVLLIAYTNTGEAVSGLPKLMDTLKNTVSVLLADMHTPYFSLEEALATIGEKLCVELSVCLSQHGYPPFSAEQKSNLKGQISATVQPDNKVRKLMESRIQSYFLAALESSQHQSPPPLPGGLLPVSRELKELAIHFSRLVNFNKLVYSPFYRKILNKLQTEEECP
ncbi:T-complex protein 11-like protein 1 [Takifugu flavidus]|uniref:T-complex protein 11-like protein 1 n=1 Tax=Takifugu flavidus TaxID=433684 RepID=A0A5C6P968_9TELE|nr:T-complex protein 11-like protein 1 [Takifugu flavidus]